MGIYGCQWDEPASRWDQRQKIAVPQALGLWMNSEISTRAAAEGGISWAGGAGSIHYRCVFILCSITCHDVFGAQDERFLEAVSGDSRHPRQGRGRPHTGKQRG